MKNYMITVDYDGTRYKGWQVQKSTEDTIQGKLQKVLESMCGHPVEVIGSGRTDAGVHARSQVANFHIDDNFTETMRRKFAEAGYKMPTLVWWNVNARMDTFHAEYTDNSVRFVSGCSATVFKSLCENMGTTPEELMLMTLNSERYDAVKIA